MRIATFNIESLDLPLDDRLPVLRPALGRLDADILCLQEVNGQRVAGSKGRSLAALDLLLEGTALAEFHRGFTRSETRPGAADIHNLVTLSRHPILAERQIRHDLVPPAELRLVTANPPASGPEPVRFERPALVCTLDTPSGPLTVINVHFRAPLASAVPGQKLAPFVWRHSAGWAEGYYLSAVKRSGQALEVRLAVEALLDADPAAAVLVTGDFNAEAHEAPVRLLEAAAEDTGNTALAARSLVRLDRGVPADVRFSVIHDGRPQMLDHMLASHALYGRFRGLEIHNEPLGDEAVGWARRLRPAGSYHAPLVATFAP